MIPHVFLFHVLEFLCQESRHGVFVPDIDYDIPLPGATGTSESFSYLYLVDVVISIPWDGKKTK